MSRLKGKTNNSDKYEQLRKKISSVGFEKVRDLGARLFQRVPDIVRDLDAQYQGLMVKGVSKNDRKVRLVEFILEQIKFLVEGSRDETIALNMPLQLYHYLSYVDLLVGIVSASTKQWVVYLLKDFPQEPKEAIPIENEGYALRIKLKSNLKAMSFLPNVQAEVRDDRIWLRIAIVKATKNSRKDKEKLQSARSSMIVYFPGEPYFYAASGLRPELCSVLVTSLDCGDWEQLPLGGKHVESLRRMRLGRDARDGPVREKPNKDRFGLDSESSKDEFEGRDDLEKRPQIFRGRWTMQGPFKAQEELLRPLETLKSSKDTEQTLVVTGSDVVSGLLCLADFGLFEEPTPRWVTNFATAGRNEFVLDTEAGKALATRQEEQWERYSQLSTRSMLPEGS